MTIVQIDFDKYPLEQLEMIADQIRNVFDREQVLIIPKDINFIHDLTREQLLVIKKLIEKELEAKPE